jgi:hypothetical protein
LFNVENQFRTSLSTHISNCDDIGQKWPPQYHTNSTLSDFNAISYVGRLWCPELITDIEQFLPVAIFKMYHKNSTLSVAILKMATRRNCSMSGINSGHHNLPTYEMALKSNNVEFVWYCGSHFVNDNGRNFSMFQHCPISSQFYMWVDNDVPNWFPTLNNFYWSPFSKWPPQYRKTNSRNCSMSRINSWHHYLPTYQIVMISDNVEFLRYCGGLVAIFKMATTISQKFNIVRFQRHFICG